MNRARESGGWRLEEPHGTRVVRHEALLAIPGVGHAFSTRPAAGRAELDLAAAGLAGRRAGILRQVHGVEIVPLDGPYGEEPEADGAFALRERSIEQAPMIRTADCVPILIAEREGEAVAAVHAGWRGTAGGIATRAVAALQAAGIPPDRMIALLGPAIGPCCYEVSAEVLQRVARASGLSPGALDRAPSGNRPRLDLAAANRAQLVAAGLPGAAVHAAPWCTACETGLFFSYRREGAAAGRQTACVGWSRPAP